MLRFVIPLVALMMSPAAKAADFSWSGYYRVEAVQIANPELQRNRFTKSYLLHHLVLQPKIVAADGLTIFGRFDVLNNANNGPYSQAGDFIGSGPRGATATTATKGQANSNVLADGQNPGTIAVTEVYGTWTHEFGSLLAGRAPMQFGLGIAQNAGRGVFDHYIDTRDMLGYKIVMGNLFIMPMYGKVNEGELSNEDDVNDYMMHVQYENPETELAFGLFFQLRIATGDGNDTPTGISSGTPSGNPRDGFKTQQWGLYTTQKVGDFTFGGEAQMVSGTTGYRTTQDAVKVNGLGLAGEVGYQQERSKWKFGLKLGSASGDDPATQDVYEGFVFDRNYDVGMLMFNHPMGRADFFRTHMVRRRADGTLPAPRESINDEGISNAIYFAPSFQHHFRDTMSWGTTLVYALLNKDPIASSGTAKDLGYELDLNFTFKPFERFAWVTEVGMLIPGSAWKGGTSAFDNKFAYGISTKAAISF